MKNLSMYLNSKKFCIDSVLENIPFRDSLGNLRLDILVNVSEILGSMIVYIDAMDNVMDEDINLSSSIDVVAMKLFAKLSNEIVLKSVIQMAIWSYAGGIKNTISVSSAVAEDLVSFVKGIGMVVDVSFSDIETDETVYMALNGEINVDGDMSLLSGVFIDAINGINNEVDLRVVVAGFLKKYMGFSNDVSLMSAVSMCLIVYRLLGDMDGSTLGDFDGMALGDLDYTKEE